jgi:hypothetical protein
VHGLADFDFGNRPIAGYNPKQDLELTLLPVPEIGPSHKPMLSAETKYNPLRVTIELGGSYVQNSFNGAGVKRLLIDRFADVAARMINSYKFPSGAVRGTVVIDKQPFNSGLHINKAFNGAACASFLQQASAQVQHVQTDANKAACDVLLDKQRLTLTPIVAELHGVASMEDSCNNGSAMPASELLTYNQPFGQEPIDWGVHAGRSMEAVPNPRPTQLQFSLTGVMSGTCMDTELPRINWNRPDLDFQHLDRGAALSDLYHREYPQGFDSRYHPADPQVEMYKVHRHELIGALRSEERVRMGQFQDSRINGIRTAMVRVQTVPAHSTAGLTRPVIVRITMGGSHIYKSFNGNGSLTQLVNEFVDRLNKQIKPSRLLAVDHIIFRMQGATFQNSFNDNPQSN